MSEAHQTSPPRHRSIFAIDVERSTERTDPDKARLRRSMYEILEQALLAGGLTSGCRDPFIDRGDGVLTLIHPIDQTSKTTLLDTVVPRLGALLAEHNESHPQRRFRLRAVVHAGEVTYDPNGCFGEALDAAFRLLEAPALKRILTGSQAPMVLVVSDEIYRAVVRHAYEGIAPESYTRALTPRVSGLLRPGWVRTIDPAQVP